MRAATAALREIDRSTEFADAERARTRATTPEMRLLQRHYLTMGVDDARRVARLDPRQHLLGCRCLACDTQEHACPYEGCDHIAKGAVRHASHLEAHKKKLRAARGEEARVRARQVRPAGLAFVAALLRDPTASARVDLSEIRRVYERLLGSTPRLRRRTMRSLRAQLADLENPLRDPGPVRQAVTMEPAVATVTLRLALLTGSTPGAVLGALVAWGIEKFADDLRAARKATPAVVSPALASPTPPKAGVFPSEEPET